MDPIFLARVISFVTFDLANLEAMGWEANHAVSDSVFKVIEDYRVVRLDKLSSKNIPLVFGDSEVRCSSNCSRSNALKALLLVESRFPFVIVLSAASWTSSRVNTVPPGK